MAGKALISALLAALLTACTTPRTAIEPAATAASIAPASTIPADVTPPRPPATRTASRAVVRPPAPPPPAAPEIGTLIRGHVTREGNTLFVTRGANEPVPLFRQAIVLASVRSALADTPATAEFRRGLLTVNFPSGTNRQIAAAINRTLQVPEVTRLRANLPP